MSTTIEWTDVTWNPVTGCSKISPGCKHCYAKQLHDMRHKAYESGKTMPAQYATPFEKVMCWPERLDIPLHWRTPRRCFVNSMADLFHEDVPLCFIDDVLEVMGACEHITFQVLTKRADRLDHALYGVTPEWACRTLGGGDYLPNLWLGVSVESKEYLSRLDALREIPAVVRFVSFEPLLEDLGEVNLQGIGWAIVGGESGRDARPFSLDAAESLMEQCRAAGVPFFMKQMGARPSRLVLSGGGDVQGVFREYRARDHKGGDPLSWPEHLRVREFPKVGSAAPAPRPVSRARKRSA